MNRAVLFFLIFFAVSTSALFFMKAILWSLFQWGAKVAVPVALLLFPIYIWSFYLVKSIETIQFSKSVLTWIWVIGFIELLVLGGLYHLIPQFFPAIVGEFFFN